MWRGAHTNEVAGFRGCISTLAKVCISMSGRVDASVGFVVSSEVAGVFLTDVRTDWILHPSRCCPKP